MVFMTELEQLIKLIDDNNGEVELWVYRFLDNISIKDNIKPTKILAKYNKTIRYVDNSEFNFKEIQFIKINKDRKISKEVIAEYSYCPESIAFCSSNIINFFLSEEECINEYNNKIFKAIKTLELEKRLKIKMYDSEIEQLKKEFVKSDYLIETLKR